jgi:host factor-I protein
MNRKLIRTTLAQVKNRDVSPRERIERGGSFSSGGSSHRPQVRVNKGQTGSIGQSAAKAAAQAAAAAAAQAAATMQIKKKIPPQETFAEYFYYKKQMDAHTPMVIVLLDGEEIEGTIEWYDRGALKINRKNAPNIMLLKRNIKYMFKAEERAK